MSPGPDEVAAPSPVGRILRVAILAGLGLAAGFAILVLGMAALSAPKTPAKPETVSSPGYEEALASLARLQEKASRTDPPPESLIAEVHAAGTRWNPAWLARNPADRMSPFDRLAETLVVRRAEGFTRAFADLETAVETELRARRYGEALETLARFKPQPAFEDPLRALVGRVHDHVEADFAAVQENGEALVEARRFAEASRWFSQHAPRFKGTDKHRRLADRPESLSEIGKAEDARIAREAEEARARAEEHLRRLAASPTPRAPSTEGPKDPAAALNPFHAKIAEGVNAGRCAGKTYAFTPALSGTPASAAPEGIAVGAARIAWGEIPAKVLVALASDALQGEDLLMAAEQAAAAQLGTEADRILFKYLGGGDRKERQPKVDETLARLRGFSAVPEGGFTYDPAAGWEDRTQRANRTAVDEAARHLKALLSSSDAKKRDEAFDKLRQTYLQAGLADEPREKIRTDAVAGFRELKRRKIEDIAKKAKAASSLAPLRALKQVLNQRREEAIKVIYNPKIYLPEDDPRWGQGDAVNGQKQVDELVGKVREIWDQPGQAVFEHSRSVERDLEEIKAVNERYLAAFGEEANAEEELASLEEIRNNLNQALSVRSYCLKGSDRQDWEWNRRVDKYNEGLKVAGVTKDEIEHAKVVNDYREMMGRRRVFLDARLCRATKKHSAVCDRAGKIWHVGSDGDPNSRAKAEGFTAGVAENVAMGYSSPAETWTRGWYRASDHHRNGLNEGWNCMGYGYSGSVGTQNFSSIGPPKGF